MNVLHLISSGGLFGAERVVLELSRHLAAQEGCRPVIGIIRNEHNPHLELLDEARRHSLAAATFRCRSRFDVKLPFDVRAFIRANRIDIVHSHGYKSDFYCALSAKGKIPIVSTNHNWLKSHWKLRVYNRIDAALMGCFDRIVAVSRGVGDEMARHGVARDKIRVIENGVDLDRFAGGLRSEGLRESLGLGKDDEVLGTVGSLTVEKGHAHLLRAAAAVVKRRSTARFLIVGDGPLGDALRRMAVSAGVGGHVVFAGNRTDIPDLLAIMDLFVLPSLKEGLPMVILEAMAARKPIVATSVGAIPDVIVGNESGILVSPGDPDGLETAILGLLDNARKREGLAAEARRRVEERFTAGIMARRYLDLYNELRP